LETPSTPSVAPPSAPPAFALTFAWCGAAVFFLSLLYFLHSYLIRFGTLRVDAGPALQAVAIDFILFTVFAVHHSAFARPAMKARLESTVTPALERSIYTWIASVLFILVCAFWQFVPGELYHVTGAAAFFSYAVQALGIALTTRSSSKLDVLDLAGVRPVLLARRGLQPAHVPLETGGLYGFVRHPLYFGWVLVVFGAPHMTMTRFVFAAISTAYLAVAIPFEERSLIDTFGTEYEAYQRSVRWRMIPFLY
jgi:protein-S-isoprenylcysteine O-methyltransferase Ste14